MLYPTFITPTTAIGFYHAQHGYGRRELKSPEQQLEYNAGYEAGLRDFADRLVAYVRKLPPKRKKP